MRKLVVSAVFFIAVIAFGYFWLNTPYRCLFEGCAHLNSYKVARAREVFEIGLKKYPGNHKLRFSLARANLLLSETEQANKIILTKSVFQELGDRKDFQNFLVDLSEANAKINNSKYCRFFALKYLEYQNPKETSKRVIKNYIRIGQLLSEKSVDLWEKAYNIAHARKELELIESLKALLLPKYFQQAEGLKSKKLYEDALKILNKAELIAKNSEISFQKAIIYNQLGRLNLAHKYFEEALLLDPENDNYRIAYATALKDTALKTNDKSKQKEYFEKIKLLLSSDGNNSQKTNLLNKIINLNAKYQILNAGIKITMLGEYLYPSLAFKIKPVSDIKLRKFKVIFLDKDKKELDTYEAPITENEINQLLEVTSRNPITSSNFVNAQLFVNDEFVKELKTK
ncbi:MAG: hypothetical protein HYY52_02315 [Candidatus Melainabacteria bacterium]|nr:hypothetical protein [Candidatus Melainabacteria bacterium]